MWRDASALPLTKSLELLYCSFVIFVVVGQELGTPPVVLVRKMLASVVVV